MALGEDRTPRPIPEWMTQYEVGEEVEVAENLLADEKTLWERMTIVEYNPSGMTLDGWDDGERSGWPPCPYRQHVGPDDAAWVRKVKDEAD